MFFFVNINYFAYYLYNIAIFYCLIIESEDVNKAEN
jgi:hypothetical protein